MTKRRQATLVIVAVGAGLVSWMDGRGEAHRPAVTASQGSAGRSIWALGECPSHVISDTLRLAGLTTGIPEYHDCQRFIKPRRTLGVFRRGEDHDRYGGLFAIWARQNLDSVVFLTAAPHQVRCADFVRQPANCRPLTSADSSASATAVPVAIILAFHEGYAPLGIQRGFNCLYLFNPAQWRAKMRPVADESQCFENVDPGSVPGTLLVVTPDQSGGTIDADYPPVARWEYHRGLRQYSAGLKCGNAWCEVASATLQPPQRYDPGTMPATEQRTLRVKGWFDEQRLAVYSAATGLRPVGPRGTISPVSELDRLADRTYGNTQFANRLWIEVARSWLHAAPNVYAAKLNFDVGVMPTNLASPRYNSIELCRGSKERCLPESVRARMTCTTEWWARITRFGDGNVVYRCVTYTDHPGIRIPGTVRWRWLETDETYWIACPGGCCVVEN